MHIKIHNEGRLYFIISIVISSISILFFPFIGIIFFLLSAYIYYFFRDPVRFIPEEEVVVSPADGIVTSISESDSPIDKENYGKLIRVSIFLSIFNVHVNRIPTNGLVKKISYVHGKFINATLDKSSIHNERNIILIENKNNETFFVTQIAGLIARRIVCEIKENQNVYKGNRFGIIKFGSRVDLYMPLNFKPLVSVGQTVIGGETIISNPTGINEIKKTNKI
jgi:phosphatidylserine decarboxylase